MEQQDLMGQLEQLELMVFQEYPEMMEPQEKTVPMEKMVPQELMVLD